MKIPFLARFLTPDTADMPPKIVYADNLSAKHKARFGTLLLDIVGDPGGHAIFNREDPVYARLLRAWDRAAYRHQDVGLGALPTDVVTL